MAYGIDFKGSNKRYGPPLGVSEDQCKTLNTFNNGQCIVSCWELTKEELEEINRTGKIFLSVWSGNTLFPVLVGSEDVVRSVVADYGAVWKREDQ